jgi:hypothetical protein
MIRRCPGGYPPGPTVADTSSIGTAVVDEDVPVPLDPDVHDVVALLVDLLRGLGFGPLDRPLRSCRNTVVTMKKMSSRKAMSASEDGNLVGRLRLPLESSTLQRHGSALQYLK